MRAYIYIHTHISYGLYTMHIPIPSQPIRPPVTGPAARWPGRSAVPNLENTADRSWLWIYNPMGGIHMDMELYIHIYIQCI